MYGSESDFANDEVWVAELPVLETGVPFPELRSNYDAIPPRESVVTVADWGGNGDSKEGG